MLYRMMLLITTAAIAGHAHAAAPNMQEGLWEITMKMEMAGMPPGMKPQVMQQCITRKDLEDPRKTAPGGNPMGGNQCQITNHKVQGNTASWDMACKGQGAMTGSGTVTYSGTSYQGTNRMTMNQGGHTQTMTMHYSGRRIGDCKK